MIHLEMDSPMKESPSLIYSFRNGYWIFFWDKMIDTLRLPHEFQVVPGLTELEKIYTHNQGCYKVNVFWRAGVGAEVIFVIDTRVEVEIS